jgi:hypothetical protein
VVETFGFRLVRVKQDFGSLITRDLMPTKTDRILSYLPGTFRALLPVTGQPSALHAIANAVGGELQQGENKLAEVMLSHWVDTADRNAADIADLAQIAALYGLAPQEDEELEPFRRHLKRYVRTFIEGTVTVQGVLRVAAEALGLEIADGYEDLDTWWKRPTPEEIFPAFDARDAAAHVLGFPYAVDRGEPAKPARLIGTPDLSSGVTLPTGAVLYLQVDGAETQTIHLVPTGADPHVTLVQLVERINAVFQPLIGHDVAASDGLHLIITSPSFGPSSRLEFEEGSGEAGPFVMGLPPLTYFGQPAYAASITGSVDLNGDLDLRATRYLRLAVNGGPAIEVDCGGATPGHRMVEEVCDAINALAGGALASVIESVGAKYLRLTSPTAGNDSSLAFLPAPGQDAANRLFGPHNPVYLGSDEVPAEVFSPDHSVGGNSGASVNLSVRYNLRLSIDDSVAITVNCAGLVPGETDLDEVANAINAAFGPTLGSDIARRVGRRLRLVSPSTGDFSQIRFETPDEADATELLFGLPPRLRRGSAPTAARLVGKKEIDEVNLLGRYLLNVRVDGAPPVLVDLRHGVANSRQAILNDLVHAIEAQLGDDTATDDGLHLILASPTIGSGSSLEIIPFEVLARQNYVSRAFISDEAAQAIFGAHRAKAVGIAATRARLIGQPDLSHGVDLRQNSHIRLSVDGHDFEDIPCAGPRPRATLLEEIVAAINAQWQPILHSDVAFSDGRHLILASPSEGAASSLRFEPPQAFDALEQLLGLPPVTTFGAASSSVTLVGLTDLSTGVDLPAHAAIKIGRDEAAPVEIALTDDVPTHLALTEIVVAISLAMGSGFASENGLHLILLSAKQGAASRIELAAPAGTDVTALLFGFPAPRLYTGTDAQAAILLGQVALVGEKDLTVRRFLRIGVDGKPPLDIDCAAADPAKTELDDIVARINAVLKADVASAAGDFLKLQSPTAGPSSRLTLERYTGGDARSLLFGEIPAETTGIAPTPASLTSPISLTAGVDLSQRSVLRIAVDGGRPFDVTVSGAAPEQTFFTEIVAAIDAASPGLASSVELDQLRLTSPTAGPTSSVEVLPLRAIELIEYLPQPAEIVASSLRHGDTWNVDNDGVGEIYGEIWLYAPSGASGPMLVNEASRWQVSLLTAFRPGERAHIWSDLARGLLAERIAVDGQVLPIPPDEISAGPLGGVAFVPFPANVNEWLLTASSVGAARLHLNNPLASRLVSLHSFVSSPGQPAIAVNVTEAAAIPEMPTLPGDGPLPDNGTSVRLVGKLTLTAGQWQLRDGTLILARLRNGLPGGLMATRNRIVAVQGPFFAAEPPETHPLLIVEQVDCLFDVTISADSGVVESFPGVTIGSPADDPNELAWQVRTSQLVRADVLDKAGVLRLPRGRSRFRYLDCLVDRFNQCVFGGKKFPGGARFAGGICQQRARFNLSRFAYSPPEGEMAVFDSATPYDGLPVEIRFAWSSHRPGTMQVRLPADLPSRFGDCFNQARFSRRSTLPEMFEHAVTEPAPEKEPRHIVNLINDEATGSQLVQAQVVPRVPLGWAAQTIPFRKARPLTLGSEETPARIYLLDPDVDGFIELRARSEGDYGNSITVAVRKSGPALFDISVAFNGSRFDSARQTVAGPDLPELVLDLLKPAPVGVRQAKSAGVQVQVTRGGVEHAV